MRFHLLHHFLEDSDSVRADIVDAGMYLQIHGRNDNDHLAVEDLAAADDFIQLCHHGVLFFLGLLHVKENQGIVGQHLDVVGLEELAELLQGVLACGQLTVEALGLNVDVIKAVFFAQRQVFQDGMVLAETVAAFVKADFHNISAPSI